MEERKLKKLEKKLRKNEQQEREMMAIEETLSRRAGLAGEPLCMYKPKPRVKKLYYGTSLLENKFIDFSSSEIMYEAIYFSTRECVRIGASLDEDDENDELVEAITTRMLIMNSMYRNSKRELCRSDKECFPEVCVVCGQYHKRETRRHSMRTCSHCPSMWHVSCFNDKDDTHNTGCCPICDLEMEFRNAIVSADVSLGELDDTLQANLPSPCFRSWNSKLKKWDDTTLSLLLTRQLSYEEDSDDEDDDNKDVRLCRTLLRFPTPNSKHTKHEQKRQVLIATQRDLMTIARRFAQLFPRAFLRLPTVKECFSDVARKVSKFHKALELQLLSWSGISSPSSPSTIMRLPTSSVHKIKSTVKYKFQCNKCNRENFISPFFNEPRIECTFCGVCSSTKCLDVYVDTSVPFRDLAKGQERHPVYFFGSDEAYEVLCREFEEYITENVTSPCVRYDFEARGGASECVCKFKTENLCNITGKCHLGLGIECNRFCPCASIASKCSLRTASRGSLQIPVEVFWRGPIRRWGIRACKRINKGEFLYCYVGVVVPIKCKCEQSCDLDTCVHRPSKACSKCGSKKVFPSVNRKRSSDEEEEDEMEVEESEEDEEETKEEEEITKRPTYSWEMPSSKYEINASRYRNVAAFMNHTCEDWNVEARYVWSEHLDPTIPMLAFYTKRTIEAGEEILGNYGYTMDGCRCVACERIRLQKEKQAQAQREAKLSPVEKRAIFRKDIFALFNDTRRHEVVIKKRQKSRSPKRQIDFYIHREDTCIARSMVQVFEYLALPQSARLLTRAREIKYFDFALDFNAKYFTKKPHVLQVLRTR